MAILATTTQDGGIKTVNARDLHEALGVSTVFANWVKRTIKALALVENVDYLKLKPGDVRLPNLESKGRGGSNLIEYHLTLSAGQRIAVSGNTEIGRALWDYLKELEAIAHRVAAELAVQAQRRLIARVDGKAANLGMNEALKAHREGLGKGTKAHIYSNEAGMIDAIVLGMSPKAWKREQGLPDAAPVRDHMSADQLELLRFLEERNAKFMNWGISGVLKPGQPFEDTELDYESRKFYMEFSAKSFIGQRDLIRGQEARQAGCCTNIRNCRITH